MFKKIFALGLVLGSVGCATVEPGYVGIMVNQYGTQKGVEDYPVFTGKQFYNPWTQNVYTWPTFTQRVAWDKGGEDGRDDSITVRSSEGTSVNLDIALAYRLIPAKVPFIFVTFRQDIETLSQGFLRDKVRDTVNNHAARIGVMQLLGPGMQKLTDDVLTELKTTLGPQGFSIDSISVVGKPRVDKAVEQSINSVIAAVQKANMVEQEVREVQAQAAKTMIRTKAESDSILLKAESQAKANKIIADSLMEYGDKLLQNKAIEKWNGVLPTVQGNGAVPFINVK